MKSKNLELQAWRKEALFSIILANDFLYGASYGCIYGFFTPIAAKLNLTNSEIGLIVAANGVGGILSSFLYQPLLKRLNKEHIWFWSLVLFALCTAMFGAMIYIPFVAGSSLIFLLVGFWLKLLSGFARSGIYNFGISFVSEAFPGGKRMVLLFGTMVAGITFGPMVGVIFYELFGYSSPFLIISAAAIVFSIIGLVLSPKYPKELQAEKAQRVEEKSEENTPRDYVNNEPKDKKGPIFDEKNPRGESGLKENVLIESSHEIKVTNRMLLKNIQIFTVLLTSLVAVIIQQFLFTGFSVYLYQEFDVSLTLIPFYFNEAGAFRILVTIFNFFILEHLTHRFLYISEVFIVFFAGLAIMSFNSFLSPEPSLKMAFLGYCVVNIAAQSTPFALNLILSKIKTNLKVEINHSVRDKVSNILTTNIFLGMVIAPLLYSLVETFSSFEVGVGCCLAGVFLNFVVYLVGCEYK